MYDQGSEVRIFFLAASRAGVINGIPFGCCGKTRDRPLPSRTRIGLTFNISALPRLLTCERAYVDFAFGPGANLRSK
jgi:hypothetical protein